jgi:hypothetical protein
MSYCFLVGCLPGVCGQLGAWVTRIVEYLKYNVEEERVDIVADIFVWGAGYSGSRLLLMHRGNIHFRNTTASWFKDDEFTPVLTDLFNRRQASMRTMEEEGALIITGSPVQQPEKYHVLASMSEELERVDCGRFEDDYAPFTVYRTPEFPAGPNSGFVFRVSGALKGTSYLRLADHISPEVTGPRTEFNIYGGNVLLQRIKEKDLSGSVRGNYDLDSFAAWLGAFEQKHRRDPFFYHVIVDLNAGKHELCVMPAGSQRNLNCGGNGLSVLGNKKHVAWYWSESADFAGSVFARRPVGREQTPLVPEPQAGLANGHIVNATDLQLSVHVS